MSRRNLGRCAIALVVGIALLAPAVTIADFRSQNGNTFLSTEKLKKAKKFDGLVSTIIIPPDIGAISPFLYYCFLSTTKIPSGQFEGTPVRKVKAKWETHAYILDHRDGSVDMIDVNNGVFETAEFGAEFQFELPLEVTGVTSTDGFKSGDVSVLLVTEADLTRGKKMNRASLQCLIQENNR